MNLVEFTRESRAINLWGGVKMTSLNLIPLDDITSRQYQNQWLIDDHMELESMGMLFGPPGSAKSFIAMDMAFCIAAGIDWNGHKTEQGKVIYLAGEGFQGIQKRFSALKMKYQTSTNDIYFSDEPVALTNLKNLQAVHKKITSICPTPRLVIIDTLHRNFGEGDENSAKDVAKVLLYITAFMKNLECAVLFVHHSGHSSSDRARGSSSIKAALDVEYKVTKSDSLVTMKCTKAKEFEEPPPSSFDLVTLPIPTLLDANGKPIDSAVLKSTTYVAPKRTATLTSADKMTLESLKDVITDKGIPIPQSLAAKHPELGGKNYIHLDDWRVEVYKLLDKESRGTNKTQANQQAFLRCRRKLLDFSKIGNDGDYFWIAA
jgi:hypothetical protein